MAKKSSRRLSDERRRHARERAREATEALLTSEGWQRLVRARSVFHSYSLQNTLLLAHQCAERGTTLTRVAGFRAWLRLGRYVRKGQTALWAMAPLPIKQRDDEAEEPGQGRLFFRSVPVFGRTRRAVATRASTRTSPQSTPPHLERRKPVIDMSLWC